MNLKNQISGRYMNPTDRVLVRFIDIVADYVSLNVSLTVDRDVWRHMDRIVYQQVRTKVARSLADG